MTVRSFLFADATRRVERSAMPPWPATPARTDLISLAGGLPAQAALDLDGLLDASRRALAQTAAAAFQSGECAGYRPLRELIAQREAERGVKLDAQRLLITSGSQQAIDLATRSLVDPGAHVLVEAPTSAGVLQALRFHGAKPVPLAADRDGLSIEALETALERYRPRMLYLMPNFANPTGGVLSLQRRSALLALAARHRFFLVEDNAYGELYFREPPPPSLLALANDDEREWVVHLASLSTRIAPGLRLAWMSAPAPLFRHLALAKKIHDTHAAALSQLVAFHYLNAGSLEPALSRMRLHYHRQAQAMQRALEGGLAETPLRAAPPAGGLFFWADAPGVDTVALLPHALAHGVAYAPGASFYCGDAPVGRLRLSFAGAAPGELGTGVRRLGEALRAAAARTPPRRHRAAAAGAGTELFP